MRMVRSFLLKSHVQKNESSKYPPLIKLQLSVINDRIRRKNRLIIVAFSMKISKEKKQQGLTFLLFAQRRPEKDTALAYVFSCARMKHLSISNQLEQTEVFFSHSHLKPCDQAPSTCPIVIPICCLLSFFSLAFSLN